MGATTGVILEPVVSDKAAIHRHAATRHESAADTHERAAGFWEGQGDSERANLHREMAEYERRGADLERRWARTVDPDSAEGEVRAPEHTMADTRQGAETAPRILMQLAKELERTADLAEQHAQRREQAGKADDASRERRTAQDAREAAQRARSQAEAWLDRPQSEGARARDRAVE